MARPKPNRFVTSSLLGLMVLLIVAAVHAQSSFVPNGTLFPNPAGTSSTYSTTGGGVDLTGPFFQDLGTNGRSCGSCHQPSDGMSVSAAHIQQRFEATSGQDPIFRTVDGSNCDTNDVSTLKKRQKAYSLLLDRGLIRIAIPVPSGATFTIPEVQNKYGCDSTSTISMYRRPLPSTNLRFLSAVMWDGRESAGARKIVYSNYPDQLIANLLIQSLDATNGHAQGTGLRPTDAEKAQIVDFEMALFTAQTTVNGDALDAQGAKGGPKNLSKEPFFISINSSLGPSIEPPAGLKKPGDGQPFTPTIFDIFDAWTGNPPYSSQRAAIARGQALFNGSAGTFNITGVAGINDDVASGGLGVSVVPGTCGTCHDTPNVGNHSFPTPLNIGTGDPDDAQPSLNKGGLDISYLPRIKVCPTTGSAPCVVTTDLGQALIDGKFAHVGKIKGPILRGLSARAPFFHNGSAKTLMDVVRFYEIRFGFFFTPEEENDLVAFLSSL